MYKYSYMAVEHFEAAAKPFTVLNNKDPARYKYITCNSGSPVIQPPKFRHFPQNVKTLLVRDFFGPKLEGLEGQCFTVYESKFT